MNRERRRYFRIEDIVGLKTKVISQQNISEKLDSFWNDQHQFSIRNEFNYKLEQHQADLNHIKGKMPELGRYLSVLQEQIDLITEKLVSDEENQNNEETEVNISAQGISFQSNEKAIPGDIIELQLKLLPSKQEIVTFSKVIDCQPVNDSKNQYLISLDFEHIHEADRELLVKHVHGKQLRALGAARFEDQN